MVRQRKWQVDHTKIHLIKRLTNKTLTRGSSWWTRPIRIEIRPLHGPHGSHKQQKVHQNLIVIILPKRVHIVWDMYKNTTPLKLTFRCLIKTKGSLPFYSHFSITVTFEEITHSSINILFASETWQLVFTQSKGF